MSKFVKNLQIQHLRKRLEADSDMVVLDTLKLNSEETLALRIALREKKIRFHVVKNSLIRLILRDKGLQPSDTLFNGPSAIAFGGEGVVDVAREILDVTKKYAEKVSVKGAFVAGATVPADGVEALSKMPSRLELLSIISGQLLATASRISGQLIGPAAMLASQVKKIAEPEEKSDNAATEPAAS